MSMVQVSIVSLAVASVLGCSAKPNADPPPPPAKTVFDPLTQQLGRARDVQKAVDANTDNTRSAVDSQERGDSTP